MTMIYPKIVYGVFYVMKYSIIRLFATLRVVYTKATATATAVVVRAFGHTNGSKNSSNSNSS